jgi:hypothetical protein
MFHMLSCFNLEPGIKIEEFGDALSAYTAHLRTLDLVESNGPIGRRQSNTIMDTDDERDQQFFVTMSFRDRAQCDRSVEYILAHEEPGHSIHKDVYSRVVDPVFICWEDL